MAITEHGTLKPVAEFTRQEKWWCDGEDCGGPGGPDLPGTPHVHPMHGPARPVGLLTGREVKRDVSAR